MTPQDDAPGPLRVAMTPATAAALEGSIEKWRLIVAGEGGDRGGDNCPLCQIFFTEDQEISGSECEGCPVYAASGERACLKTPWQDWARHFSDYHGWVDDPNDSSVAVARVEPGCRICVDLARAELAFLEGLRVDAPAESGAE